MTPEMKAEIYDRAMLARPKSCDDLDLEETILDMDQTIRTLSRPLPTPRPPGFVKTHETDNSITYGADFPLPDDDTTGVERSLRVRVEVPDNGSLPVEVRISLREKSGRSQNVGYLHVADLGCIANLLHPAAALVTVQRIEQR